MRVLTEFVATTTPAAWEPSDWRRLLRTGAPAEDEAGAGPASPMSERSAT